MIRPSNTALRRDKRQSVRRVVLATFAAHTAFVGAVLLVDRVSSTLTFRNLHEQIVDRHAYEAWWWLQGRFPHEVSTVAYPVARSIGLEATSFVIWVIWYVTVGALPYAILVGITVALRRSREKRRPTGGEGLWNWRS